MPESTTFPLPPWRRVPRGARTALVWCATAAVALLLYGTASGGTVALVGQDPPGPGRAVAAAATAVPLRWAWHRPGPVLAALLVGTAGYPWLGLRTGQVWPLVLAVGLLVGRIAATGARRAGLVAGAVALAVLEGALQTDLFRQGGWGRVLAPGFLGVTAFVALAVPFAWLAGRFVRQREEYRRELLVQAESRAVTAERLRIGRELHDMVAHGIGVVAIQAGAGARVIDGSPERAREALLAIEATSRETLRGLRQLLGLLREPQAGAGAEAEPSPGAGLADLERLVATTARAGVRVEVRVSGERRPLPPAVDRSAFRIVQESVANVVRHAGTDRCEVTVDFRPGELRLTVRDDGPGSAAPVAGSGYGIRGMRERVALLGGRLDAGPLPAGGFRVTAHLPLTAGSPVPAEAR
ncbi:sensor histidine kinase [Kitasatospora sp. NPDC057198]|uniref:sensor histidine kinase n=1 Tax=Kitasatospora sp. NPDC057198 TaxID=3346046 RepID=UPI0036335DFB